MDQEKSKRLISEDLVDFLRENDIRYFNAWNDDMHYHITLDADGNIIKSMILNAEQYDDI
jgi:hypothetical protein